MQTMKKNTPALITNDVEKLHSVTGLIEMGARPEMLLGGAQDLKLGSTWYKVITDKMEDHSINCIEKYGIYRNNDVVAHQINIDEIITNKSYILIDKIGNSFLGDIYTFAPGDTTIKLEYKNTAFDADIFDLSDIKSISRVTSQIIHLVDLLDEETRFN